MALLSQLYSSRGVSSSTAPGSVRESTNAIESMIEICRDHSTNVKRWSDGQMALRWCAAGMVEAAKQFRQPGRYQIFQQNELSIVAAAQRHQARQYLRHLDDGEQLLWS